MCHCTAKHVLPVLLRLLTLVCAYADTACIHVMQMLLLPPGVVYHHPARGDAPAAATCAMQLTTT
jgi:hypothetical protein